MKTGFKDRNAIPEGKKMKSPFNFDMPCYDERTSCYVTAGTDYGVAPRQPVGHTGNPKKEGVPFGRPNTMKTDYIHKGKIKDLEIEEDH